jgi:hypothetical protein
MVAGSGRGKAGYKKIEFCGKQAARDGLRYFWIDSCCIDKSRIEELAEAISSKFRWYQNAAKCYVYLSDVSTAKRKASDQIPEFTWEPAFRTSSWFTRSWTLQELLAPVSVEFFSLEGKRLGDKKSLGQQIHEITGIAVQALQGTPLSHFSVAERMSWAQNRTSLREEDMAYSLLGIFDVYMPFIYGEGRQSAFRRLQEEIDKTSKNYDFDEPAATAAACRKAFLENRTPTINPERNEQRGLTAKLVLFCFCLMAVLLIIQTAHHKWESWLPVTQNSAQEGQKASEILGTESYRLGGTKTLSDVNRS